MLAVVEFSDQIGLSVSQTSSEPDGERIRLRLIQSLNDRRRFVPAFGPFGSGTPTNPPRRAKTKRVFQSSPSSMSSIRPTRSIPGALMPTRLETVIEF
jgi:hypothetical protein